jgi:hypothetical protein
MRKESVGPETEKRAPSAKNFKSNFWRPIAALILVVSSQAVYNEEYPHGNQDSKVVNSSQVITEGQVIQYKKDASSQIDSVLIADLKEQGNTIDIFIQDLVSEAQAMDTEVDQPPENIVEENSSDQLVVASITLSAIEFLSGQIEDWLIEAGWPHGLLGQAKIVVLCESTNRPHVVNPNGLYFGLFQLGKNWFDYFGEDFSQWSNPVVNARVAYKVYQYDIEKGNPPWKQWDCKP